MKSISAILCTLIFLLFSCLPVTAQTQEELLEEQYSAVGADELMSQLPDSAEQAMDDSGIDSPETLQGFQMSDFFQGIWGAITGTITKPLHLLAISFGVMLLCALVQSFRSTVTSSLSSVFSTVTTLSVCGVLVAPVVDCIIYAADTIRGVGDFLLCFVPVFTGIVTVSGMPTSGLGYQTALFGAIQVVSSVTSKILVPFLGIFLALSIIASVSGQFKISKLTGTVKKVIIWGITLLLTIFTAIFSTQSIVSVSTDTVGAKTAKFMVSSFVPVVGSAIGDAFASVQGCLGVVRSSVGAFGIIACLFTFLPPIVTVLFYMLAVKLAGAVGQMFQLEAADGIFEAVYDALSILMAFLISFSVLTIVCTALMISMHNGG